MVNSVQIKNYRGIKDMKIENFKKYNIFTGDNGSCKTTVMEALAIGEEMAADIPVGFLKLKKLESTPENIISFFYNTDSSKNINILINNILETEITVDSNKNIFFKNNSFLYQYIQKKNNEPITNIKVQLDENNELQTEIIKLPDNYQKSSLSFLTPEDRNNKFLAEKVQAFIENKRKNELLEILKKFDSQIDDIISDGSKIKISLKESISFLPLMALGNGIPAILEIVVTTLDDCNTFYIDEIETGIHYLNYPKLCSILVDILKDKDTQVFITTHSKEFIKEFYYALKKHDEEISLYKFEKIKNQLKQHYYSNEEIIETIEEGWDVR